MKLVSIITKVMALVCLLPFTTLGVKAQSFEVNIMTGGASGTYIQFGRNIAQLAAQAGRDNVIVVESAGSMENIDAVKHRPRTQFGIVQSDVLDFIRTFKSEDPQMRSILRNTRYVFPLYKEEVHVVTTRQTGINTLLDLSGKTVAIGAANSGTNLTATFLLEVSNVRPGNVVEKSAKDALSDLVNGTIDAFFYVAGAPTTLLREIGAQSQLKLVTIPGEVAGDYYGITTIPAGTYPWLKEEVETAAVRAVLMTYEYDPNKNEYFRQSCEAVSEISYLIMRNLPALQQSGHPKWNQVDLTRVPSGWEQANCVKIGLSPGYQPPVRSASNTNSNSGSVNNVFANVDCSTISNPIAKRLCLMRN